MPSKNLPSGTRWRCRCGDYFAASGFVRLCPDCRERLDIKAALKSLEDAWYGPYFHMVGAAHARRRVGRPKHEDSLR